MEPHEKTEMINTHRKNTQTPSVCTVLVLFYNALAIRLLVAQTCIVEHL